MTTRRGFLASLLAASALPTLSWADAGAPAFLAAARDLDGSDALYGVGDDGADRFRIPLPARAHAGAAHPTRPEAVVFARRPGTFALVVNCATGAVIARLASPEGRHFMGHGTFSADGDTLFTAENAFDIPAGRIGLWSRSANWRRVGEIDSHGIGPHDVKLLADGTVLVVANGGIETRPDQGRRKLNLPGMAPNVSYITAGGDLLDQVSLGPDLHLNSIRHLALASDDTVAFAMQWEGEAGEDVPLLGLHRRGAAPVLALADAAEQRAMQGYAGSVAISPAGDRVAITSPRGGRLHVFDIAGRFIGALPRADICGLGQAAGRLIATDGLGGILALDNDRLVPLLAQPRAWDNHVVPLKLI